MKLTVYDIESSEIQMKEAKTSFLQKVEISSQLPFLAANTFNLLKFSDETILVLRICELWTRALCPRDHCALQPQACNICHSMCQWGAAAVCHVNCDILLTAPSFFPMLNSMISNFSLNFSIKGLKRKLILHISHALGKTTFGRYCSVRWIKEDAGRDQHLALNLLARTGSDVICPNSMLYLSASSFSILLKSMRLLMSFNTSAYD